MNNQQLVGITEAARIIGVHVNTLRKWSDANLVPHLRTPTGYRRFSVPAMERFREQMERGPEDEEGQDPKLAA